MAWMADELKGARPRLVWRMTPVALITGSKDGEAQNWRTACALFSNSSCDGISFISRYPSRTSSRVCLSASKVKGRPYSPIQDWTLGLCNNCSTEGKLRNPHMGWSKSVVDNTAGRDYGLHWLFSLSRNKNSINAKPIARRIGSAGLSTLPIWSQISVAP